MNRVVLAWSCNALFICLLLLSLMTCPARTLGQGLSSEAGRMGADTPTDPAALWRLSACARTEERFISHVSDLGRSLRQENLSDDERNILQDLVRRWSGVLLECGESATATWLKTNAQADPYLLDTVLFSKDDWEEARQDYGISGGATTPFKAYERRMRLETALDGMLKDNRAFRMRCARWLETGSESRGSVAFPTTKASVALPNKTVRTLLTYLCADETRCIVGTPTSWLRIDSPGKCAFLFPNVSVLPFCPFGAISKEEEDGGRAQLEIAFLPDMWRLIEHGGRDPTSPDSLLEFVSVRDQSGRGRIFRVPESIRADLSQVTRSIGPTSLEELGSWLETGSE